MRRTLLTLTIALLPALTTAQSWHPPEEFTAIALSPGGPFSSPVSGRLVITIDRWSTEAERQRLLDAVKEGQDAALEVMRHLPVVGTIRTPTSLAWDLHYAHQQPGEDGGRQIFLATDRPIGAAEAVNRPRTILYPFTLVELRLDENGAGEGKLSRAVRVTSSKDGRYISLENYEGRPVDLTEVKPRD